MIPINLIRQFHFCPRIVYYSLLTNIKPIYPKHVELGLKYHEIQEKLSKNRKFKKLKINYENIVLNKFLEDSKLGIYGKADLALIAKDEVVPIEFKFIKPKKPSYSHILQLFGYGYLFKQYYNKEFKRMVIIYSNNIKVFNIEATEKHKEDFIKTVEEIKKIANSSVLPDSSANEAKCLQCEYLNFCDDRF